MKFEDLQQGDWFFFKYGFDSMPFYVIGNTGNSLIVGTPRWLVSSAFSFTFDELNSESNSKVEYAGRGKLKWYWKFLPWRDLVCPFTKPYLSN